MARDHARIKTKIWEDPAFLSLKVVEQYAYIAIVSHPKLSWCGVVDYIPARFEGLASDLTETKFKAAVRGLTAQNFVVIDTKTQELLVRSYVRHDNILDRTNMGKAVGSAFNRVASSQVRAAIGVELARYMAAKPHLEGWRGLAATSPEAHAMACGMTSPIASRIA